MVKEIEKTKEAFIPKYGLGQGIGLCLKEQPFLEPTANGILQPGMALSLRLALRSRGMSTLMIGHTILVSDYGIETLTK